MIELLQSNNREPGTWKAVRDAQDATIPELTRHAIVMCPVCDKAMATGLRGHCIASDGTVTPSLMCHGQDCTFHEYVRLVGWEPQP